LRAVALVLPVRRTSDPKIDKLAKIFFWPKRRAAGKAPTAHSIAFRTLLQVS
jgi:hypothetical protein